MSKFAVLFILLLLPLVFAQTTLEKFLNTTFEPDQSVQTQSLFTPSGSYLLVIANGTEFYVLDAATAKPVTGQAALTLILTDDAKNRSGYEAKLASAKLFEAQVNAAKDTAEKKCMQYTGTDSHECIDKQTCTVSCFAVPLCSTPLYSDGFWEAMLDWTNGRKNFGSLLSSYSNGLDSIAADTSAIDQKISALDSISAQAANLSANQLFLNRTDEGCSGGGTVRCFEYCPKIDYSLPAIASQKSNLQSLKSSLASVLQQSSRASSIIAASKANDDYESIKGKNYQEFRLEMQNTILGLNKRAAELAKNFTDPEIAPLLGPLSNLSAGINQQADAGLIRQALLQKGAFTQQANAISGKMDADAAKYNSFSAKLAALNDKISKSENVIGTDTAISFRANVTALSAILSTKPTSDQLAAAGSQADIVSAALTEEIVAKATGGQTSQPPATTQNPPATNQSQLPAIPQAPAIPSKLPCLPGLILLALVGFTFGFAKPSRKI